MPSHGKEIPLLKRVAILTLHWYGDKNWIEISTLLKVHPETARAICVRAKERATDPNDFDDVLQHLENLARPSQDKSQHKAQHKERPTTVKHKVSDKTQASLASAALLGPEELDILERSGQHKSQPKDQQRAQRPAVVKHKGSNATNVSTESKELEILEEDLSLVVNGFVSCHGSLEGVTMMRDMDWR